VTIAARLSAAISAALVLIGCGQYLGEYTAVSALIATHVPLSSETSSSYGQFLEIRLVSDTSVTSLAGEIDGLYVDADFCPLRNSNGLIAFGPFSDSGDDLGLPSAAPALRTGADGRFYYRIYIPVAHHAHAATRPGQFQLPTYDLRQTQGAVCLRLFAPGYNLINSRSDVVMVPAEMISTALSSEPAVTSRRNVR
jgi:hypothetical protein